MSLQGTLNCAGLHGIIGGIGVDFVQDYVERLRDQVADLKQTLHLISASVTDQRDSLEKLSSDLRQSLQAESGLSNPAHQLPTILRAILSYESVGAFLVGVDGRCLLSNPAADFILSASWIRNPDSASDFALFLADKETKCDPRNLPWQACAKGAEATELLLFLRRAEVRNGIWIRTASVPLKDEHNAPIGAVAFLLDVTEQIQVEEQIKNLLGSLEEQLAAIDTAHTMLSQLTAKLRNGAGKTSSEDMRSEAAHPEVISEVTASKHAPAVNAEQETFLEDVLAGGDSIQQTSQAPKTEVGFIESASQADQGRAGLAGLLEKKITVGSESQAADNNKLNVLLPAGSVEKKQIDEMGSNGKSAPRSQKRVLIVDDIPVNQKLLRMQLSRFGFEISTALNGQEAVEAVEKTDFDFVFMDLDMPVMNGPTAAATIRKMEKETGKHVPIIAMTSYDRDIDRKMCSDAGMDYYLVKGASHDQLTEVINVFLPDPAQPQGRVETASPVDLESLKNQLSQPELEEVFRLFNSSINTFVECMQLAIQEKNVMAINHFAHCIKGPAAAMQLSGLTVNITRILSACEAGEWERLSQEYLNLKANFAQVLLKIRELCEPSALNSTKYRYRR